VSTLYPSLTRSADVRRGLEIELALELALAEYRRFKVPAPGPGQFTYMWATDCVVDIECHLDHEPAEDSTPEYPGCDEVFSLRAAYVRGVDILEMLSPKQIERIEELALVELRESLREAKAEAHWEAQEERLAREDHL
jgi:hypothetical protein